MCCVPQGPPDSPGRSRACVLGSPCSSTTATRTPTQVLCLDNFFTGSRENVAHLLGRPNFELIRHDVTEPIRLEVDHIYHLACPASPVHYKWVVGQWGWRGELGASRAHGAAHRTGVPGQLAAAALAAPAGGWHAAHEHAPTHAWLCAPRWNPIKTAKTSFIGTMNMLGLAKRCKVRPQHVAGCCAGARRAGRYPWTLAAPQLKTLVAHAQTTAPSCAAAAAAHPRGCVAARAAPAPCAPPQLRPRLHAARCRRASSSPPRAKCTGTRCSTRRPRSTGAT